MMKAILIAIVLSVTTVGLAMADSAGTPRVVGQSATSDETINVPMMSTTASSQWIEVHSYVPSRTLTQSETSFLQTVPLDGGLREAVRQMLQAGVVHVPDCGRYREGDSVRYWSMYQVWTAPYKAEVPIPEQFCLPALGPLPEVCQATPIQLEPVRLKLDDVRCEVQPVYTPVPWPRPAGSLASGSAGWVYETQLGGVWKSWAKTPKPCPTPKPPPTDATCPPGGNPPKPPSTGNAGRGTDGSGSQGPGQGSPGGYGSGGATLPTPPPGYGSTTPPTAGPPPPTMPGVGGGLSR